MLLLFNSERLLARVAADARVDRRRRSVYVPWHPPTTSPQRRPSSGSSSTTVDVPNPDDARLAHLTRLLELALTGPPETLCEVLTEDARGWSPTLHFDSLGHAEEALGDDTSVLEVSLFRVERLCWSHPVLFAEWYLEARQAHPLLIGEDVLVEPTNRLIILVGATVAVTRGLRFESLHTYFDDASLIEQVIVEG